MIPLTVSPESAALNRIADALFQQAKVSVRQLRVSERQAAIQEQMLELQQANLAVTKQLEAALTRQVEEREPQPGDIGYVTPVTT